MWFTGFQILICQPLSIWRNLLVLNSELTLPFKNEKLKVENAESVCKIQQNLFADYHVQFPPFALIADTWENLVFLTRPLGKSILCISAPVGSENL